MKVKVWLTKYALTRGIETQTVRIGKSDLAVKIRNKGGWSSSYVYKPHWHASHAEAVARAAMMRTAKIASLQRSLQRMEALDFSEPTE